VRVSRSVKAALLGLLVCVGLSDCVPFRFVDRPPTYLGEGDSVESTDPGFSQLTGVGMAEIADTERIGFDLSDGRLLRSDVGLANDAFIPDVHPGPMLDLTLVGSKGTLRARTDYVRFGAPENHPEIDVIFYFLVTDTPEGFFAILREAVELHGFDSKRVEEEIDYVSADLTREYEFVVDEGYKLGFGVSYEATYRGPGHVNVVTVTVAPDVDGPDQRW